MVALGYHRVTTLYRATSRELMRLDGVSRSPVYAAFARALGCRATLRAFGQARHFYTEGLKAIDENSKVFMPVMIFAHSTFFFWQ